jgi:hypothetical protein
MVDTLVASHSRLLRHSSMSTSYGGTVECYFEAAARSHPAIAMLVDRHTPNSVGRVPPPSTTPRDGPASRRPADNCNRG